MADIATLSIVYAYGAASTASLSIRYAYEEIEAAVSELPIVTSWDHDHDLDRWHKQRGCWAWSTQDIANLFPHWHQARNNIGGVTQQLLNASAQGMDLARLEVARFQRSLFLTTLELDQPDLFWHAGSKAYDQDKERRNLLQNPGFSVRGLARRNTPAYWSTRRAGTTGLVSLEERPSLMGTHSAKLYADTGENAHLQQAIVQPIEKGADLTFSIWYLVPIPIGGALQGGNLEDDWTASLYMSILYADGTMEMVRQGLALGTNGKWRRAHVSVNAASEIHMVKCVVHLWNERSHPISIYVGGAQLERGSSPSAWTDSTEVKSVLFEDQILFRPVDTYVEIDTETMTEELVPGQEVSFLGTKRRHLFPLNSFDDFWYRAVPARCTATVTDDPPTATQMGTLGWYSTKEGETFMTRWRVHEGALQQYYSGTTPYEIICQFGIGEFWLEEEDDISVGVYNDTEDPSFSRTLETVAVHKQRLWVVCLETENGVTKRIVKILNPRSRWPVPTAYEQGKPSLHLECVGDFEIPVATGTVEIFAPGQDDPDIWVLRLSGVSYLIQMEYDVVLHSARERRTILRHEYDGQVVTA